MTPLSIVVGSGMIDSVPVDSVKVSVCGPDTAVHTPAVPVNESGP
jgi:hypothetical protein